MGTAEINGQKPTSMERKDLPSSHSKLLENEEDEVDIKYTVRDLVFSGSLSNNSAVLGLPVTTFRGGRTHLKYKVNFPIVFYLVAAFLTVALAEVMLRKPLEKAESKFIVKLQGDQKESVWRPFFDFLGFPPEYWGVLPGVALTFVPGFRLVSFRIVVLNAIGRFVKWNLNHVFFGARPFWMNPNVRMWHCPQAYGCPSGHALLLLLVIWPIFDELLPSLLSKTTEAKLTSSEKRKFYDPELLPDDTSYAYRDVHIRYSKLWAIPFTVIMFSCYGINMFSRVYLGTHFLHDIIMGIIVALLLLMIVTSHNIKVALDRLSTFASESYVITYFTVILVWAFLLMLLLVVMTETVWALSVHVHGKDPEVWTVRAKKSCTLPLEGGNPEIALPYVYGSIGALLGNFLGITMLAWPDGRHLFPNALYLKKQSKTRVLTAVAVQCLLFWVIYSGVQLFGDGFLSAWKGRGKAWVYLAACCLSALWAEFCCIRLFAPFLYDIK